ncbi:B3 domain-containing protein [Apostasia shenzhenica]|uniref:B3 domain-containing protein n=1 Tax=Apostasia shenzhenica TaxID=1088818 RepID=A0A2I0AEJ5_9ASPA|nr:B3 domain-containing protein [Apostasia shenzhenica]
MEHSLSTQESDNNVRNTEEPSVNEIIPLLGIPYFTTIMAKSQVEPPHQLVIPNSFLKDKPLPHAILPAIVTCRGKTWDMTYHGNRPLRRFYGWKKFVEENDLRIGDGCIFELVDDKELKFKVQILDGQLPEMFSKLGSAQKPINID